MITVLKMIVGLLCQWFKDEKSLGRHDFTLTARKESVVIIFAISIVTYQSETLHAAPITKTFKFTASGFFAPIGTATPPQDPVFGSFTVSYDTTIDTVNGTLDFIDLTIMGFSYNVANTGFNYDSTFDNLTVGVMLNGISGSAGSTDDFIMSFRATTLSPTFFASFSYSTSSTPSLTPGFLADTRVPPSNVEIEEILANALIGFRGLFGPVAQ